MELKLFHCIRRDGATELMVIYPHLIKLAINLKSHKQHFKAHSIITILLIYCEPVIKLNEKFAVTRLTSGLIKRPSWGILS